MAPSDWRQRRFADVAEIAKESVSTAVLAGCERVRLYSIPAFDDRREPQEVAGAAIGSNKFEVPQDCVLLSRLNPRIPRVWRVTHDGACRAVSSTEFWPISAVQREVDHDFLAHFLRSSFFLEHPSIRPASTTNSHQRIEQVSVERFTLALPPLAEQRKIAAILSSVDETIEKTEAVIAQLDVVKKAMLEELLTRGIPGRHSRFKQTEIGEVPEEWPLVPLGDAGRWLSGGTPSKATPEFWNGEIPWVSPKDMKVSRIADAIDHVSEAAIGSGTILAPARSILIVIRGMILVHSVPVALTTRPVAFNQDMKALVVNDAFVPEFLLYWLQSKAPAILQLVDVANHGTKRLPSPLLFALPLPQPSRHEQEQVCEVLAAVDRRIDSETKVLSSLASTKQNLSASLLSGETRVVGALTEAR